MTQHTATPYREDQHANGSFNIYTDQGQESMADETLVAFGIRKPEDARFIVTACNLFDEFEKVVRGGESAVAIFEDEFKETEIEAWLKDARALLAKIDKGK